MQPPTHDATLHELALHGQRFTYRRAGSGPLIVLLHGMVASGATWNEIVPRLAATHTVIAPDLVGHGASAKPLGDYSLGTYANLVRDLLEALGEERGTIVGHSLGGGVAMQFAYQFPERCERLVLVSSGGLGRGLHPALRAAALPGAELVLPWFCAAARRGIGVFLKTMAPLGLRPPVDLGEMGRTFVALEEPETRHAFLQTVRGIVDAGGQRVSATDRLYLAEGLPLLILWGDADPLIPVGHGRRAQSLVPGSRLEIFPQAGHYPHLHDPRRFAEVILDFAATTEARVSGARLFAERLRSGPRRAALG